MATVNLSKVQKSYGTQEVVHGIDLDVKDDEFVVLLGPSGCGKSTTLRMVAGLEDISGGEIRIGERVVNDVAPKDRKIAMVFQNYALYPHMTVSQNMAFGLKLQKMPKPEIKKKVDEVAEILELGPLLERRPAALSGGQRQRVAMGRAIVREPALFLFDEPLSNLDAKLRVQMRLEIKQLQAKLGVTSLYVTHDQVEAMTMADRMIVMNDGLAEQIGTPLEVYETPATLFAAQFIGSPAMNVFEGTASGGKVQLANGSEVPYQGSVQGPIWVGMRPEHLEISANGFLAAELTHHEPLGSNTLSYGKLAHTDQEITVSLPGIHRGQAERETVNLSIDANHLHFFDKSSGQRIDSNA